MKKKTKVLLSSLLAIGMSASLATGATYALFTSTSQVNVAVTSGTVNVVATVNEDSLVTYSNGVEQQNDAFELGGSASYNAETATLTLDKMCPLDSVAFSIDVTNNSNVEIQYRVIWNVSGELAPALTATADGAPIVNDVSIWTPWTTTEAKTKTIALEVAFPDHGDADNEYMNKTANITFAVEAVQGNGVARVDNATELKNALATADEIVLDSNIDLSGETWTSVAEFDGILEGNGYSIIGLTGENGLAETLNGATIRNLTIERATITATNNHTGIVAGSIKKDANAPQTLIENVTVSGTVSGGNYYTGGLIGADSSYNAVIRGCVNNADVTGADQQIGGILGYAKRTTLVENCVNNGNITGAQFVGGIIGLIAMEDDDPSLFVTVRGCENKGIVNTVTSTAAYGAYYGGIAGAVGREGGNSPEKECFAYLIDCTVLDGEKVYGGKINVATGKSEMITVYVVELASDTAELIDQIKNAPVGEETIISLTGETYTEDINITVAALGQAGGDIVIKAAEGATPVIAGTVTIGYRQQNVGAATYAAKITFDGITFDHAEAGKHCLDVQDVESFYMVNCTVIGDGEYGLSTPGSNGTGAAKIENCKFINAGLQLAGKFAQTLIIDNCEFEESVINVQGGGPLGPTIQNSTFDITLKASHSGESFYVIRNSNAGANIQVKKCTVNVDAEQGFEGVAGPKGWGVFVNRIASYDINAEDVTITMTEAALAQSALQVAACLSTGKINMQNVTMNGVLQ